MTFSVMTFLVKIELQEISNILIIALDKPELGAVANFQVDHKRVYSPQGDTMGIQMRFTWINKENKFKSFR